MKRRDLLKTGLAMAGASTIALTGCAKNNGSSFEDIIPRQTSKYEFSTPLPFNYKTIDELAELNSKTKKSQVKILYNNIPAPLTRNKFKAWVHLVRGKENPEIKTLDDFGQYVKYALDKGFEFSYLMNSPKTFSKMEFSSFKDDFLYLLDFLKKTGVKNIKVSSNQLASLVYEFASKDFNLQVSTCYELNNISQYKSLFKTYPKFNFIDVPKSENQNFALFKSLKKLYPDKKIELMINERCIKGCPARMVHNQEPHFCESECKRLYEKDGILYHFIKIGTVYPWDMEYYSAMRVNNFKFISLKPQERSHFVDLTAFKLITDIVENGYENYTLKDMINSTWFPPYIANEKNSNIKLSEIAPLFPDIRYFIKNSALCTTNCEAQCKYCFECADRLKKELMLG